VRLRKWVKLSEFQKTFPVPGFTEFGVPSLGASALPPSSLRLTCVTLLVPKTLIRTSPSAPDFPSRHKLPATCAAFRHHLRPRSCSSEQAVKVRRPSSRKKFWFGAYNLLTSVSSAVVVLSKALYEFLSYQQQNMLRWIQHQGVIVTPLRFS